MDIIISVVIVSNRSLTYLKNCLNSIKKQKFKKYELILILNGIKINENDEIIKLFKNIKIITNNSNLGTSKARNQGIINSSGEYILYLDDDAILLDNYVFDEVVHTMYENRNIGQLGGIHYGDYQKRKDC